MVIFLRRTLAYLIDVLVTFSGFVLTQWLVLVPLRTTIKLLPWELAHLTNNLPVPMRYVPNPGFRLGFALAPILITIYSLLVLFTPKKQSLHDLLAKTIVTQSTLNAEAHNKP